MTSLVKAKYYSKDENGEIKCLLCPRYCVISENNSGNCGARINIKGELYTLNYNNPVALNIDPIEKKPFFHFLSGTLTYSLGFTGCNLHCKFCQNWQISQTVPGEKNSLNVTVSNVVKDALKNGCSSIAFTYNEPTVAYEMMLETAKEAKKHGLYTLMVSNGYINRKPLEELIPFIDAVNIDVKGFTDNFYKKYTGGDLATVLENLKILYSKGVFIEITNLMIAGLNDDMSDIAAMSLWIKNVLSENVPVHFSRFFPAYMMMNLPPEDVSKIETARNIAIQNGLKYVYTGNIHHNDGENTFCPECKSKIVERSGFKVNYNAIINGRCRFCNKEISGMWEKEVVKKAAFAGSWYPGTADELIGFLNETNLKVGSIKTSLTQIDGLIAPHAGYVFSGEVAASAYKAVQGNNYDTVVLMGTSHIYRDNIISVFDGTKTVFPTGELEIDKEITKDIVSFDDKVLFIKEVHEKEHSLELHLPFIKYYLGNPKIVLLLTTTSDKTLLEKCGKIVADSLRKHNRKSLIVLSTDLSHYHPYEDAYKIDKNTIDLILSEDYEKLDKLISIKASEMCGYDSFVAFRAAMNSLGADSRELVLYKTSADTVPESKSGGVVGYTSIVFGKSDKTEEYSKDEKELLLNIARMTIKNCLDGKDTKPEKPLNEKLTENRAVFVTLKINDELRGCIGEMIASRPLYLSVYEMAKNAAFRDPRFYPISKDEIDKIKIEISILTPMKKIENYKEINLGIDGVLLYREGKSGVFLPQVAEETGWDLETFMENLSLHKAGLPKNAYKDEKTDIYVYQVVAVNE